MIWDAFAGWREGTSQVSHMGPPGFAAGISSVICEKLSSVQSSFCGNTEPL